MSCCGCSSRVLKLQSEVRSWKAKLGDEKREKKMILRWVLAVFGYDVEVFMEKEKEASSKTHEIRLQATENREAMSKALIKSGAGGSETEYGMMVMELKLEDHEFYEPFEEPHPIPEFPILEINSMSTSKQPPIVNTGITSFGHLSQQLPSAQALTITSPLELTKPIPVNTVANPEVMYLAGNFDGGTTLQGPNGQSYVIVRASEGENISTGQTDFGDFTNCIASEEVVVRDDNVYIPAALPVGVGNTSKVSLLPPAPGQQITIPGFSLPTVVKMESAGIPVEFSSGISQAPVPKPVKRKPSLPMPNQSSEKNMLKKQKPSVQKTNSVDESLFSFFPKTATSTVQTASLTKPIAPNFVKSNQEKPESNMHSNTGCKDKESWEFGLTLREKAEMYVLQKAKETIEMLGNSFRCKLCEGSPYTYSNFEKAMSHTKTHFESKPYKCEQCEELFAVQREFLKHKKTAHPKSKGVTNANAPPRLSPTKPKPTRTNTNDTQSKSTEPAQLSSITTSTPTSYSLQTKAVMLQVPFDNNLIKGPVEISGDALAAILGSSSPVILSQGVDPGKPLSVCNLPSTFVLSADTIKSITMAARAANPALRAYSAQGSEETPTTDNNQTKTNIKR